MKNGHKIFYKKSPAMIDYAQTIKTFEPELMKNTSTPIARRPAFTVIKPLKKVPEKTTKSEADNIPFEKWIMPPPPEEYIKGRRFDFL